MKQKQQPAPAGSIQITMTPRQLDVIMGVIEGMLDWGDGEDPQERDIGAVARMVEKGAREWHPGYDYKEFGVDFVVMAPAYRQMLEAWRGVEIERNTGNEFDNVFEFVEAVKLARVACAGGEEVARA